MKRVYKIFSIVFLFILLSLNSAYTFFFPLYHAEYITKLGYENYKLVHSVIKAESNFNNKVKSSKGAVGVMQILPSTANFIVEKYSLKKGDLYDAEYNILIGVFYIKYLEKKFLYVENVLAAYNAGEGNVIKWLKDIRYSNDGKSLDDIPFEETRNYVKRVKKFYKIYDFLY